MKKLNDQGMKIAVYLRTISGEPPDTQEQLLSIEKFLQASGLEGKRVSFEDIEDSRAGFKNLVRAVAEGKVHCVICSRFDRLDCIADDVEKSVLFLSEIEKTGARFIAVENGWDSSDSSVSRFTNLLELVDQSKTRLRVERVRSSLQAAKNSGRAIGRPAGEFDQEVMKYRRAGMSIRAIATKLKISASTVQAALYRNIEPRAEP